MAAAGGVQGAGVRIGKARGRSLWDQVTRGVLRATLGGGWVEGLLLGVGPVDPLTYVGIAITLGIVSLVASLGPAWGAARVDPAEVLRRE
jgi:hypothetical protein